MHDQVEVEYTFTFDAHKSLETITSVDLVAKCFFSPPKDELKLPHTQLCTLAIVVGHLLAMRFSQSLRGRI